MIPDPDKVADYIREAAERFVMPRFRSLADSEIHEKKPGDIVTIADLETERFLEPLLLELVPGSVLMGEEGVKGDEGRLEDFRAEDSLWILDPVDGTANFADGRGPFMVMAAFCRKGETVASWLYEPLTERMAMAAKGEGATVDGQRIAVAEQRPYFEMYGVMNSAAYGRPHRDVVRQKKEDFARIERTRCAGANFLMIATGETHFSLYDKLWPWDHAPGVLLHAEAGGYSARVDGNSYAVTQRVQGLMSAPSKECWEYLNAHIDPR